MIQSIPSVEIYKISQRSTVVFAYPLRVVMVTKIVISQRREEKDLETVTWSLKHSKQTPINQGLRGEIYVDNTDLRQLIL